MHVMSNSVDTAPNDFNNEYEIKQTDGQTDISIKWIHYTDFNYTV